MMAEARQLHRDGRFGEGFGHAMQAKGMKLVEGWMFEQVVFLLIVVARTTDVGMHNRRSVRGGGRPRRSRLVLRIDLTEL